MPNPTKRGGLREPAGGRPAGPAHLRRRRCGFMTLPKWLVDWLAEQDRPAGHIVEDALIEAYKMERPE